MCTYEQSMVTFSTVFALAAKHMTADMNKRFCQRNKQSTWAPRPSWTQNYSMFVPKNTTSEKKEKKKQSTNLNYKTCGDISDLIII